MLTLALSVVLFIGCKKDSSVNSTSDPSGSVSADWYRSNKPPVIKTGPDQTYTTAVSSITLDGSGSYDPDGTIAAYAWSKDFGPSCTITSPSSAKTTVTGMTAGIYRFKLKITDNKGASVTDTIRITNGGGSTSGGGGTTGTNQAPTVSAGSAQSITLPASSVTLTGTASDPDGTIASYLWTKVAGSGGTISSPNTASTTVTGLTAGSYTFNLKVTDNAGATANSNVNVTVNSATTPPPTGNYSLLYSSGYDILADLDPDGHGQIGNGYLDLTQFDIGPGSFRSRPANVSAGIRSEVQYDESRTPTEGAVEYDVRYNVIVPNNGHSFQFHPNTSGGSASPGLWFESGKFVWNNWIGGVNQSHSTGVTAQTGHWYHMRNEYKFGSNGYWRSYMDGVLVCSWTGQVGDGSGQYLKIGYNGWDANSTQSDISYDNIKIWKLN